MFPYKICKGWRDEQLACSCALMVTCGEYFPFSSMQSGNGSATVPSHVTDTAVSNAT